MPVYPGSEPWAGNPVVPADCPDPDVIRVGEMYYMASTTMHFFPGGEILQSRDLVHWSHAAYLFDTLPATPDRLLQPGHDIYGQGMWAPSLRYWHGSFYCLFAAQDTREMFLYTAQTITGPWVRLPMAGFYHDPSLLFIENGAYLAYGNSTIWILPLKPDLSGPMRDGDPGVIAVQEDNPILGYEGSHLQYIHGHFYLSLIHSRRDRWRRVQACFRADHVLGPYTGGDILDEDLGFRGQGIAQGGLVDTPDGRWYAMLFQDRGAVGRLPVLVPLTWRDGLPVPDRRQGLPAAVSPEEKCPLVSSDDFRGPMGPWWQFNHLPDWSLVRRDRERGAWRVRTGQVAHSPAEARNTLTMRMLYPRCAASVLAEGADLREGDVAGLCALQGQYGMIGIARRGGALRVVRITPGVHGVEEHPLAVMSGTSIRLAIAADFSGDTDTATLYLQHGTRWERAGTIALRFTLDHFTGCRFALAVYSAVQPGGTGVFRDFRYYRPEELGLCDYFT